MKEFAASFRASMRLVESVRPMASSIEPEASSTSTMSSGVVAVSCRFDVDEMALKAVRKSESPLLMTFSPPAPERTMSSSETVLSTQMRPTFWVLLSRPQSSHVVAVEGSATVVAPSVAASAVAGGARADAATASTVITASRIFLAPFMGYLRSRNAGCIPPKRARELPPA